VIHRICIMMFSVTQNVFFRVPVDLTVFNKGRKPSEGQMNNKLPND
jgi:hypothetical protein